MNHKKNNIFTTPTQVNETRSNIPLEKIVTSPTEKIDPSSALFKLPVTFFLFLKHN